MGVLKIGLILLLLSPLAEGQTLPQITPSFEVASVKLHDARGGHIGINTSGTRLTAEAMTVAGLIMYAYNLKSYQVPYTPALTPFGDRFYDIAAKSEGDRVPTVEEFRQMMRSLLATRFKLSFHQESRQLDVYALVAGKDSPKFKQSPADADPTPRYTTIGRNVEVILAAATMADVVRQAENSLMDRPVVDRTEISGNYSITLTYTPNTPPNRGTSDPDDIDIFRAVQKIGLKLEPKRLSMPVMAVDHIEPPSAN